MKWLFESKILPLELLQLLPQMVHVLEGVCDARVVPLIFFVLNL